MGFTRAISNNSSSSGSSRSGSGTINFSSRNQFREMTRVHVKMRRLERRYLQKIRGPFSQTYSSSPSLYRIRIWMCVARFGDFLVRHSSRDLSIPTFLSVLLTTSEIASRSARLRNDGKTLSRFYGEHAAFCSVNRRFVSFRGKASVQKRSRESATKTRAIAENEENQGRSPLIPTGRTLSGERKGRGSDGFTRKSSHRNFKCRQASISHRSAFVGFCQFPRAP